MNLKILIALLFFFNVSLSFSQEVEIIKKSDSIPQIKEKGLAYINSRTNLDNYYFIARVKVKSNNFNIIFEYATKSLY